MRKFLATLLVLIFLPIFVFVFLSFNVQSVLFNKETIKQSLTEIEFYSRIAPAIVRDNLNQQDDDEENIFQNLSKYASEEDIIKFVNRSFPPEALKYETEKTIDVVYPYMLSETDSINLEYSLKDYKKEFIEGLGDFTKKEIDKLPECTKKQMEDNDKDEAEGLPSCKPPGISNEDFFNLWTATVSEPLRTEIPDKIIITEKEIKSKPGTIGTNIEQDPITVIRENIRASIKQVPTALKAGFGILLALLILIALLRWGSYRSMAKWIGWTLLLSTIASTVFSLSVYSLSASFKGSFDALGSSAVLAADLTTNLLGIMIFSKVVPQAIVIVIISLALIIIPYLIKPKKEKEVAT
jgi:hypothetical protein